MAAMRRRTTSIASFSSSVRRSGCAARIWSSSVVPDRGNPTRKTGSARSSPLGTGGRVQPSIQSAVIGAILLFLAGRQLLLYHLPEQMGWLPATPRGTVLTIGLITAAGLAIQWALFRRQADKG